MAQGNDSITSTAGDGGKGNAVGKGIDQTTASNVVNNYLDHNNPERSERKDKITLDERLDRLEVAANNTQRTLSRIVALMDGDPSYRIVGLPDQMAAYIKSNEDWKVATEKRIVNNEDRLDKLEGQKQITLSPGTAWLFIIIGVLALVSIFFILSWFQNAGRNAAMIPAIQALVLLIFGGWHRGY